ncbi:hypothetical protein T265_10992 [Opisthorchis viverrini]|uniref:Uncharacterized protein n=1 Tax=Opisthorchis viverrini TaxID=6198 RepID=A0A074ZZ43_OPIVI|nr:hypothetical protein T265_10992 [Opisthorchis viverrini]KER20459.1 hypothetical protein T265_10992 [Opisthorchis viverrini]
MPNFSSDQMVIHCGKARMDGILTSFTGHQRLNDSLNTVK